MSPLRQHLRAALHLRGTSERPQEAAVREVPLRAPCDHTSPGRLAAQALQHACLHRTNVDGLAPRDVMEWLRRVLPHVLPDGVMPVRHGGLLPASCAMPLPTIRRLSVPGHPRADRLSHRPPPQPCAARDPGGPTHGTRAPASRPRRLRTGVPPPACGPQRSRGAPRRPPWPCLTMA